MALAEIHKVVLDRPFDAAIVYMTLFVTLPGTFGVFAGAWMVANEFISNLNIINRCCFLTVRGSCHVKC